MRRVISSAYMSVDGVVENPVWAHGHSSADGDRYALDQLLGADTLIMGRRTYESFAQVWPTHPDDTGMAERINAMPKLVASDTLTDPAWTNSTVVRVADVADVLRKLKQQPGQDVLQYGFGPLTAALMREHLLDELRLLVHPVLCGAPAPADLLARHSVGTPLRLADVRRFDSGVVLLCYRPAGGDTSLG